MAIINQRIKKLEKTIYEKEPKEFVTILGLAKAEMDGNDKELQRLLEILRKTPPHHREHPIGYEKYFND